MATPSPASTTEPTEPPRFGPPYETWLATHDKTPINAHRNHYQTVSQEALRSFNECAFWKTLLRDLPNIDAEYLIAHKFPLIVNPAPTLIIKPWTSFLQKTYRKNISTNVSFPHPPVGGWYLPFNWYNRIHDIIRTTIIVKYLDGVPLVLEQLKTKS